MMQGSRIAGLEQLKVPADIRMDLEQFLDQLIAAYDSDLVSIIAFGSAVTGDYAEKTSDVNLLVIYADLEVGELKAVAKLAQDGSKSETLRHAFFRSAI